MYFPYFRGKQFELILLREQAKFLADNHQVPIIAPVRYDTRQLKRTIDALNAAQAEHVIVVNPSAGDHAADCSPILNLLRELDPNTKTIAGLKLGPDTDNEEIETFLQSPPTSKFALIHNKYGDHNFLRSQLSTHQATETYNIFLSAEERLYKSKFNRNTVLIEDGFTQRRNREYPPSELFSDLYLTHSDIGYDHFGDYLTVGETYHEGGGPAYAVAIHITYINTANDNTIWINHYISDSNDSPSDPGNKAREALRKLSHDIAMGNLPAQSNALNMLLEHYKNDRYPGLGMLKKLSMWHHLCVMKKACSKDSSR